MMAYSSSVHVSIGYTPYKVVFGQEMVIPVDMMLDVGVEEAFHSTSIYVSHLVDPPRGKEDVQVPDGCSGERRARHRYALSS